MSEPDIEDAEGQATEQPDAEGRLGRRKLLTWFCLASAGGGGVLIGAPVVALLVEPLLRQPSHAWRGVGPLSAFPLGRTLKATLLDPDPLPWAGLSSETAVWVRRTGEEEAIAFGAYCTHVGCPVDWNAGAELFLCPCHGGAFFRDGTVAAGPPPRPLVRHDARIRRGHLEILTQPVQAALGGRGRRRED